MNNHDLNISEKRKNSKQNHEASNAVEKSDLKVSEKCKSSKQDPIVPLNMKKSEYHYGDAKVKIKNSLTNHVNFFHDAEESD